ncbi:carbamoyl-phosphate synthase (glutamine-hydrolyzing) large subunit [Oceanobacillus manasiensis]|uniref:carbamoyl-phosphate synthase (glutamine-hydrolyzing) large subunit n=1 Tax=Oceanobacillus manasiensis TaxID=586413 RepID=UPI0005A6B4B9|nr:carbamoyl-phosphate synthase (glutamine-hydrolyzing) large subunit [Oceanobacillus manasiensis]
MPRRTQLKKVLVIGSGPIVIGQAAEFDYAGTQACLALKEEGIEVILVNNNPATIMTDKNIADHVYMEPLELEILEKIIAKEKPDGVIGTLGGQTGLNLTVQLFEKGILDQYGVQVLGTPVKAIQNGEDRNLFRNLMLDIDEPIPESRIIKNLEEGLAFIQTIGFPVILRPAYTLGGEGGGFAHNESEFAELLVKALSLSPINQVLVEKSIKGWKEVEYEVMRDKNDTCIIVCNMENMDPVGVHTGDSIVVAPSQTLNDVQYQLLRTASLKVIRELGVVGGCNIQFAIHPASNEYRIIEVNPRVSRSSALASKATGYPIARIAAKCAVGFNLDEILNPITGNTYASFEPALDYIVVKLPRFPFDKFTEADRTLGTQMKATGEVMAIDRTFEGALNKAIRSLELNVNSLHWPGLEKKTEDELEQLLHVPNDLRLFAIGEALNRGMDIDKVMSLTEIDYWFIRKLQRMIEQEETLVSYQWSDIPSEVLRQAKRFNCSDERISELTVISTKDLRKKYKEISLQPAYKLVDTCAGEFDAITPYYYSTWHGVDEVETQNEKKKILVLGSGPIRIGQGIEFDYCAVQATMALKELGYETIVMNNNPETVSTDYSLADSLYFEPLALEDVLAVIHKEKVDGVLVQFGGQTAINLVEGLVEEGVPILGTTADAINKMEDRDAFYQLLDELEISHIVGKVVSHYEELKHSAKEIGFPILIRPSYVIGGQSMFVSYNESELLHYVERIEADSNGQCWPLLLDSYLPGLECEVDVISDGEDIVIPGIYEHVEKAGVHSGDSMMLFPSVTLTTSIKEKITKIIQGICRKVPIIGVMNVQFIVYQEDVFVIEVNPRSSRTIPIISKVTDVPIVDWAVQVQLGKRLASLTNELNVMREPSYFTIKAPVFSDGKLKGVDHVLGPEMKSTGEIIGLGESLEEAMNKIRPHLPSENLKIFVSIADRFKKEALELIKQLANKNVRFIATEGTANYIKAAGLDVIKVTNEKCSIEAYWTTQQPDVLINIPSRGRERDRKGFYLRELATRYSVTCFTSLDTARAILLAEEPDHIDVCSLTEYMTKEMVKK